MIVIADASPVVGLIKIGHVDILPGLHGSVTIPPEVLADLIKSTQAKMVRAFDDRPPAWLQIRSAEAVENIAGLDAGECAAIALAMEIKTDVPF